MSVYPCIKTSRGTSWDLYNFDGSVKKTMDSIGCVSWGHRFGWNELMDMYDVDFSLQAFIWYT